MTRDSLLKRLAGKQVAVLDDQTGKNIVSGIAELRGRAYFVGRTQIPRSSIRNVTRPPSQRFYQGLIFVDNAYDFRRVA